jgi:outer membrane immunogenic protein
MKIVHTLGVIGLLCVAAGSAHAADLMMDPPIVDTPEAYDWTGFYAGVAGGWGAASVHSIYGPVDPRGFVLGADVGYNQQFGQFVLGGEADLQWTGMNGSIIAAGVGSTIKGNIDYYGTVRGRAGIALDRFMPYVTGGLSYGHGSGSSTTAPGYTTSVGLIGWTAGVGAEYAVTDSISLKGELDYHDYGNVTYYAGTPIAETIHSSFGTARVGLNFKF